MLLNDTINHTLKSKYFPAFVVAILYFFLGKISYYFALEYSIVTISIFFSEGIALAAVIIYGKRVIPGIFFGQFFLALSVGGAFTPAFLIALTNSFEALLAIWFLKKMKFDKRFFRLKDVYILFAAIIFILQPFSSFFGSLILKSFSIITDSFMDILFAWWFGNIMGQLLMVPMILLLYENKHKLSSINIIFVSILFIVLNYFFICILHIDNIALLFSVMIPLIMLLSRSMGLHYAGIAVLAITISSLYMSRVNIGIFTDNTTVNNLININFYILAHIIILYIHGVLLIEKEMVSEKLATLNKELNKRVKSEVEKNREKEWLMMQQSRFAQTGEMLAIIAHQWRQPLNTLAMITQRIYIKYNQQSLVPDVMEEFNRNTQTQITHMSETIDDFRSFFKPEKKKKIFDIKESLDFVLSVLQAPIENHHINVVTDFEENIMVEGYRNEFSQVILNLINNAVDAFEENNNLEDATIIISLGKEEEDIYIRIEDNAGGIPEEILSHIFDPYCSTKSDKNGTGLGLYIAKIVIEKYMVGELKVENRSTGACFTIFLKNIT